MKTVGQKSLNLKCFGKNNNGNQCRGILHDTVLDWEDYLPPEDLELADLHSG